MQRNLILASVKACTNRVTQAIAAAVTLRNAAIGTFAIFPFALWLGSAAIEVSIHSTPLPDNMLDDLNGTPVFLDRNGSVIAQLSTAEARVHIPVSLSRMGAHLPETTIALEDHRFRQHRGIDMYAICAAAYRSTTTAGHLSGASTVSQQAIKLADRRRGRALSSKIRESLLALKLERQWDKATILKAYINRLDYGNRRIGPEAAAWAYFGKAAATLTLAEAIYLAGLPQSPTRYNPWLRPGNALTKYSRSLKRLMQLNILTAAQFDRLATNPPSVRHESPPHTAPAFIDALMKSRGNHVKGELVTTTLDSGLQHHAENFLAEQLAAVNRHDVRNAGMVVIENSSGAVRALASVATGKGQTEGAFNAALVPRHAGSTLKPFIYLMAIDARKLTAASLLPDTPDAVPRVFPGYEPQNYNRKFAGPVRIREALGNSLNIPAVLTLHRAGPRSAFESLTRWGLHTHEELDGLGAGFVLGNRKVRLLDLACAYAGLARSGLALPPTFLADEPALPHRMASAGAVEIISDILADDHARSASFGHHSVLHINDHRSAVKTGTSSSHRDAWTVGFDHDYTVAIWVGNLNGRTMNGSTTIDSAAPAWRRMMTYLAVNRDARPLPESTLPRIPVDSLTGMLPGTQTRSRISEIFLAGTKPIKSSDMFYDSTGSITLPEEYALWCSSKFNHLSAVTLGRMDGGPRILTPQDGATFVVDHDLPNDQQKIALRSDSGGVVWRANGRRLVSPFLVLAPGKWTITAHAVNGATSASTIRVLASAPSSQVQKRH
jgi:penicillin-binding protein 1C